MWQKSTFNVKIFLSYPGLGQKGSESVATARLAGARAPRAARAVRASSGMFEQTQEVFKRGYIRGFEQVTCRGHNLFATPPCGTAAAPCTPVTRLQLVNNQNI